MCVCACVRACMRPRACECARACVGACNKCANQQINVCHKCANQQVRLSQMRKSESSFVTSHLGNIGTGEWLVARVLVWWVGGLFFSEDFSA